jgi:hypothetical protein
VSSLRVSIRAALLAVIVFVSGMSPVRAAEAQDGAADSDSEQHRYLLGETAIVGGVEGGLASGVGNLGELGGSFGVYGGARWIPLVSTVLAYGYVSSSGNDGERADARSLSLRIAVHPLGDFFIDPAAAVDVGWGRVREGWGYDDFEGDYASNDRLYLAGTLSVSGVILSRVAIGVHMRWADLTDSGFGRAFGFHLEGRL